jgi:rfaE bifunctional protein kinase chain/domain
MIQESGDYRRKIKTRDELRAILGPRPRPRSAIMCHGTFDLVHPGHIRHLMYAKGKADILIASLTCDAHVSKANHRPFVPQQLRAMNLAALEVVDYVIIDDNPTPLENIAFLQPDYFAKGYEYTDGGIHPKTHEEMTVLSQYGGEIIFTPGDVVYSSSRLIDAGPPNIAVEKLMSLMESEGIDFRKLQDSVAACAGVKVHVIGDTIIDSYAYCTPTGGTSKTPTLSLKFDHQVDFAGGAAVVARHLRAAGADVTFSTVLGNDPLKAFVLEDLERAGVRCLPVVDRTRPTTQKKVYIAGTYRMLKVDTLDSRPVSDRVLNDLSSAVAQSSADVVVFSDFRHGIFNRETIPALTAAIRPGAMKVADSQVASRWGNILEFHGFDLITPNEREARFALGDQDSIVRPLALDLYRRAGCKVLILKLGDKGVITYREASPEVGAFFIIDSFAGPVVDPVGAGDGLLAYATLGLAATRNSVVCAILGSMAAAVACEHEGNTPISPDEVLHKLALVERRVQYS